MNLLHKATALLGTVKTYWKSPPPERYMPFKEIFSLSFGGIGVRLITYIMDQMIISTGNAIMANTIGIQPMNLYIIYIISLLTAIPLTGLRAQIIDNTRSKKGKYRPYIISMGIPTIVLGIGFMAMPYEHMNQLAKCLTVLLFNIGFQFFYSFFNDAYQSLIYVLSPNSIERSDVVSIRSVVENFSPSIVSIVFPLIVLLVTGQKEIYNINAYRFSFPPLLILGMLISVFVYVNTEEKIVRPDSEFISVRFIDAFRAVASNKYFWIISLAGWIGFLESAFANILNWMYNYQNVCEAWQYSVIIAITGNASFWPNLVGPFLIRKYGKKKILIFSNLMNVAFILLLLPIIKRTGNPGMLWILVAVIFINQFLTSLGHLLSPAITADIRDYQQYISGERIDGMFAAVGLIGNFVTIATGFVLPYLYEKSGLTAEHAVSLGFDGSNVYDVLYNKEFFISICSVLIIASVIGAALNVIPYFFYDLTEAKQSGYVSVMKIRAFFEDKAQNLTNENDENEIMQIIRDAEQKADLPLQNTQKLKHKEKQKADKYNDEILIARFICDELNYYKTQEGQKELEYAELIIKAGLNGFTQIPLPDKAKIKAMTSENFAQKRYKNSIKKLYSNVRYSEKNIRKHYNGKLIPFDDNSFHVLLEQEKSLEIAINEKIKAQKKNKQTDKILTDEIKLMQKEKRNLKDGIKKKGKEKAVFHAAAKPYFSAQNTVLLANAYNNIITT